MPSTGETLTIPTRLAACEGCARATTTSAGQRGRHDGLRWDVRYLLTACGTHETTRVEISDGHHVLTLLLRTGASPDGAGLDPSPVRWIKQAGGQALRGTTSGLLDTMARLHRLWRQGAPLTQDLVCWAAAGWDDAGTVRALEAAQMTPVTAWSWSESFGPLAGLIVDGTLTTDEMARWWLDADADPDDPATEATVMHWWSLGVRSPDQRPAGLSRMDVEMLVAADIDSRDPGWAGAGAVCAHLLRFGIEDGQDPAAIVALFAALRPHGLHVQQPCRHGDRAIRCGWAAPHIPRARDDARVVAGLDWSEVALCLRAGMGPHEAAVHRRQGRDMDPVRLVAALSG